MRELMTYPRSILVPLFLITSFVLAALLFYSGSPVTSQTPNNNLNANIGRPSRKAIQLPPRPAPTPTTESSAEVIEVDVDLVKIDALVLQKNTARIVGGLQKEDFLLYEDGIKQDTAILLSTLAALIIPTGPSGAHNSGIQDSVTRIKSTEKTVDQVFKNIQVLNGMPQSKLYPTMRFMAASLGFQCG